MLKRAFALSDQGAKDLAKGIIATACANLIQIIPASLLLMVVMMLLEKAAGTQVNVGRNIPFFVGITLVLFGMIAIAQLVQYNLTYTAAYKESANRRIVLAEKLRKLPLSFFEKKNLADLTTTIMGDCTALERTFSCDSTVVRHNSYVCYYVRGAGSFRLEDGSLYYCPGTSCLNCCCSCS